MINETSSVTGDLVKLALDAALLRHQVIANNIANSQTPGYIPQQVKFEELLDQSSLQADSLKSIKPVVVDVEADAGDNLKIRLDLEMANMTRNVLHYQALLSGLGKYGAIKKTAITGGK